MRVSTGQYALDRFLEQHEGRFLYRSNWRLNWAINGGIGLLLFFGGLIALIWMLATGQRHILGGAIGPMLGGLANLAVAVGMRHTALKNHEEPIKVTPEATALLNLLSRRMKSPWVLGNGVEAVPEPFLSKLDTAADAYNRLVASFGAENALQGVRNPSTIAARTAADETMAEILHLVAIAARYPESSKVEHEVGRRVASLVELAERLEAVQARTPTLTDRLASTSTIERVLEDLRAEAESRAELERHQL